MSDKVDAERAWRLLLELSGIEAELEYVGDAKEREEEGDGNTAA